MGICQSRSYVESLTDLDDLEFTLCPQSSKKLNEPLLKRLRRRIIKDDS